MESFVNALCEPAENHNILVDFLGFDGWPAAYVLGQICEGHKFAAGTICHSLYETKFVGEMTSNKIFSLARENKLKIPGFPNFMSVIKDLKKSNQSNTQPQYTVCTPLADGGLVIKSALIDLWTIKNDGFQDEAATCQDVMFSINLIFWHQWVSSLLMTQIVVSKHGLSNLISKHDVMNLTPLFGVSCNKQPFNPTLDIHTHTDTHTVAARKL